jgi:glycosyltransferase involved in cell wall biosynthesis
MEVFEPVLSVCFITYNHEQYIRQALDSVLLQQVNFSMEVVIGNDCSTDGTTLIVQEYLEKYPDRIRLNPIESNIGMTANWLSTIQASKGKYIAMLEGDDYWTDVHKLQKQVDFLDANPDYSMHCTGYWLNTNGIYTPNQTNTWLCSPIKDITTEDLFVENYVSFGRMFRNYKDLIKPYMMSLPYLDYPVNYELSLRGKIRGDEWVGGIYREHGQGVLTSLSPEEKKQTHKYVRDYLYNRHNQMKNKTVSLNISQLEKDLDLYIEKLINKDIDEIKLPDENVVIIPIEEYERLKNLSQKIEQCQMN